MPPINPYFSVDETSEFNCTKKKMFFRKHSGPSNFSRSFIQQSILHFPISVCK